MNNKTLKQHPMIKKLSPEELAKKACRPASKKHPVRIAIEALQPKEAIEIPRKDFAWKGATPQRLCNQIQKKSNKRFKVSTLLDNSGWIVERLE